MVQTEIERRWLLKTIPLIPFVELIDITQFYIQEGNEIVRYRREDYIKEGKIEYYKIIKKNISHGINTEEVLPIEYPEFYEKRKLNFSKEIVKLRHIYQDKEQSLKFEIDRFQDFTLTILEVELKSIEQEIKIPDPIKDTILMEITGMKQFSNYSLSLI